MEVAREKIYLTFWAPKSLQMVTAAMKLKDAYSLEDDQPRQHIKKQRHYFANKVVMYGCESWTIKKSCVEELKFLNCGVGEDS